MVTSAKKPRAPRKKRVTSDDETVAKKSAAAAPAPAPVMPPLEDDDAPLPGSYKNEPDGGSVAGGSEEPDFGLGIGDILRNDSIRAPKPSAAPSAPSRTDAKRLSIDSILRGDALEPQMPASLMEETEPVDDGIVVGKFDDEDADIQAMRPERSGGAAKSALFALLVLALFLAAAGGVYVFLSKNGIPSFIASRIGGEPTMPTDTITNQPVVQQPVAPESASVTVLVGLKAPDAASTDKTFLVTRAVESDGKTSGTFPASGNASSTTDRAVGTATIINTTARPYDFVATTRLLSKEGVLFRMTATTRIPANGSVDVQVRADQPGAEGDIGPTTFTIPGLPPDQQKLITAKSDAAMTGGSGVGVKGVSQTDIDAAKSELTSRLRTEAIENFGVMLLAGEKLEADLVASRELASEAPKIGTAGETFPLSITVRFSALLMPEKDVMPLLETAMAEALPSELSSVDYELGTPHYTVQAYDTAAGVAEVRVDAPIIRR